MQNRNCSETIEARRTGNVTQNNADALRRKKKEEALLRLVKAKKLARTNVDFYHC